MSGPQIIVVGLGATGSAALFHLARRGVRAIGIEQFSVGHDRGSSHGATRIFRFAHFENASYVPLLRRAYALWRELENTAQKKLITITGIIEIGPGDGALITGTLAAARRYELRHELLDAHALMSRFPSYKVPATTAAVFQPDAGVIAAAGAIEVNVRVAEEAGAVIRAHEKVLAIEPTVRSVKVKTTRAEIEADGLVMAAGPWMKSLLPDLGLPLRVTRQVVGWFEPEDAAQYCADRFPVFLLESRHGIHYGFPTDARNRIKISKHHHAGQIVDPDEYQRRVTDEDEALIRAPLVQYLPGANGRLLDAETCLYTTTPDDTFIIDRMPGYPHIVIASPCCGHGFKFSPVVGEIIADLATRGTSEHDISPFRLRRFR